MKRYPGMEEILAGKGKLSRAKANELVIDSTIEFLSGFKYDKKATETWVKFLRKYKRMWKKK